MNFDLVGKTAIVSGSTQGIGKAAAVELAKMGATLVLIARNEEKLKSTVLELDSTKNQVHSYIVADFSKPDNLKSALSNYVANGGKANILIN